jgi:hypothetical protein
MSIMSKTQHKNLMKKIFLQITLLIFPFVVMAQLAVTVSLPNVTGSKAVVQMMMKNNFAEKIGSARAVAFLMDDQGKVIGQTAKWVIGGSANKLGLAAGETNAFNFVIPIGKQGVSTNLTAKVSFNRVVLGGGKLADVTTEVIVTPAPK